MHSLALFLRPAFAVLLSVGSLFLLDAPGGRAQAPGAVDPTFGGATSVASLGLAGQVTSLLLQPDGKVIVGGSFKNGLSGLVRLNADGSLDPGFQPAATGSQYVLQPDGKILLVPANYSAASGAGLSRLNADGSLDTGFQSPPGVGVQMPTLQPDGKIVAILTGSYSALGRLNADGSLDPSFQVPSYGVGALAVQPDGKVVVVQYTDDSDYGTQATLIRLSPDGNMDPTFQPTVLGSSNFPSAALALQPDGKILVSLSDSYGGANQSPSRYNADGSPDTSFQGAIQDGTSVNLIVPQPDGKILVSSSDDYAPADLYQNDLVRLNADGSLDPTFQATVNNMVNALVLRPDGEVLIGGNFTYVNDEGTSSAVLLGANGQVDGSFKADVAPGPNANVAVIVQQPDGKVVIGGSFSQVSGASQGGITRLNADGSVDTAFLANANNNVTALALQPDGKIVVGGHFTRMDGTDQTGVARLNTDGSLDPGFQANAADLLNVDALVLQPDGKIIVGHPGTINSDVSGYSNALVRLNADGSVDAGFQANAAGLHNVSALALRSDGKIVVIGEIDYSIPDSPSDDSLVRLNADGTVDPSFSVSPAGTMALLPDDTLVLYYYVPDRKGYYYPVLGRFNADDSRDTSFQADVSASYVAALAAQPDGKVILGGNYVEYDNTVYITLARLNADGSPDVFFDPGGSGPNGSVDALLLQSDGKIFVGGDFTNIDGTIRNYVARLDGGDSTAPAFFDGSVSVGGGFYYLQFPDGTPFGYYNLAGFGYIFPYFFHDDLGLEYFFDARDGKSGAYLYDFASSTFFYTSPTFPWPYLYDFSLNTVLYYFPDPNDPGHYNTGGVRYFYNFATGRVITK